MQKILLLANWRGWGGKACKMACLIWLRLGAWGGERFTIKQMLSFMILSSFMCKSSDARHLCRKPLLACRKGNVKHQYSLLLCTYMDRGEWSAAYDTKNSIMVNRVG